MSDINFIDSLIIDKLENDSLEWWDTFKSLSLLHETIEEHKKDGKTLPDGLPSAAGILAKILLVAMDKESTTPQRKNALWRSLGLGNLTTDTKMRNIALAGCIEILKREKKSILQIEESGIFQELGVPTSAIKQAAKLPVVIPDHYGMNELQYFKEQLIYFQDALPKKGPPES